jgi:ribosomal protein S18 acetylase RimI-like enzyme
MEITIREAQLKDTPPIIQLISQLAAADGEHSPITAAYVEKYLSSPGSKVLLAEKESQVIGLLCYSIHPNLYHAGDACLIEEFIVREAARGQGVGSAILTHLLAQLSTGDCAEVSVSTSLNNTRAIKFYRAHGLIEEVVSLEKHFTP